MAKRDTTPVQRLLLDLEALAIRFENLRLELVEMVWTVRQHANSQTVDTHQAGATPRPRGKH